MILDGESGGPYHQWQLVTPVLKKELDETGLFQVDVVTAPPAGAAPLGRMSPQARAVPSETVIVSTCVEARAAEADPPHTDTATATATRTRAGLTSAR